MNRYTVRLMRNDRKTVAAYEFDAADDSLSDAGLTRWLSQFSAGHWPYYSVLENGTETGLQPAYA